MKKVFYSFLILLTFFSAPWSVQAQRIEKFSSNSEEFIKQLGDFMTANKLKEQEVVFDAFKKTIKAGTFEPNELEEIMRTANNMLSQKLTANPYFTDYLQTLTVIKNTKSSGENLSKWHAIINGMLNDIEKRRLNPLQEFLSFSYNFFRVKALRFSTGGVAWLAYSDKFDLRYENKIPIVVYDKLDLVCLRKKDSIAILNTAGTYYPVEDIWKGKGGKVTWDRFGLTDVYSTINGDYQIETKKSLYTVGKATLHYPALLPDKDIEGNFEDKITVETGTEGSYPRFKSFDNILKISNLGGGAQYTGGFRLEGLTVYGYGSKKQHAKIVILNDFKKMSYRGEAELFVIRKNELIAGERVESVVYFGSDSIYHPSVNLRFEIPKKEMSLTRGERGSDRNPFVDSYHKTTIDSDKLDWKIAKDSIIYNEKRISIGSSLRVPIESFKYFSDEEYRRIQNIATTNPISVLKVLADEQKKMTFEADVVAKRLDPKFSIENIQSLLYDMVAKGFINYDSENQLVTIKDKIVHYANASTKKVDFDNLKLLSETERGSNASFNFRDKKLNIDGVKDIEFSQLQKVAVKPSGQSVLMKENRNMDFGGKMFAGYSNMYGKGFHFDYDKYQVDMDSVRFMDLFVPTGDKNKAGNVIAPSMESRLEYLQGVLLIDAPGNKSGKEDIEMFPSFQSKKPSFVYYDKKKTQDSCYTRDSFYFKLEPFSFNRLDNFVADDIHFKGTMVSSKIFPNFQETLILQEDRSLGFKHATPSGGFPVYSGKGQFQGDILMSNKGMLGKGMISYIGATVNSEDIIFKPKQMLASAKRFDLKEDRAGLIKVPQVKGTDVNINWRPYRDSMYITTKEKPFEMFQANNHTLKGTLILTPRGVRGRGVFDWDKGIMTSKLFTFGAYSTSADTMDMQIKALGTSEFAFDTRNIRGVADFDEQVGRFKANSDRISTTMPYNKYQTSMNEFNWDMKNETVTFKADERKLATFLSTDPEQDSLRFQGKTAFYNLKSYELKIGGVPFIQTADAYVYTETGDVDIRPGGVMSTLENARIICDTINKYHIINRATVNVKGRKLYTAKGYYEYNIGDRKQEILFTDISGARVGKGQRSEKKTVTRATGAVVDKDSFYVDHKTEFRGKISLNAESKNLRFEGFASLQTSKLPNKEWFSINCDADKKDLAISYDVPKNYNGEPLRTGVFLSKESGQLYPSVLLPLYFRKDRPFFEAKGLLKYNKSKDEFNMGDSLRVTHLNSEYPSKRGNLLNYRNKDGKVIGEGKFTIGSNLKYVTVEAAGSVETQFIQPSATDTVQLQEMDYRVFSNMMAAVDFYVPEKLMATMVADLKTTAADAQDVDYNRIMPFYEKALAELIPEEADWSKAVSSIKERTLELPKRFNKFPVVFSYLPMRWNAENQSFITIRDVVGVASVGGEKINKQLTCSVEFKMPSTDDADKVFIHIKAPSEYYYYFGYQKSVLTVLSNNPRFMEEFNKLKKTDLLKKMPDGENYEIQLGNEGGVQMFVNRIQETRKK